MSAAARAPGLAALVLCGVAATAAAAPSLDLRDPAELAVVQGTWRYADARLVESQYFAADAAGDPLGRPGPTFDIEPHAGRGDFDDAAWPVIAPDRLAQRRGAGRVSFGWYRLHFEVPEAFGTTPTHGHDLVFSVTVDDYAEVWVDGELARGAGQRGGSTVSGWNAENRVLVARDVRPGRSVDIAVFAINGPLSDAPGNYVFLRDAHLELAPVSATPQAVQAQEVNIEVERLDAEIDQVVPRNAKLFKLAEGFVFTEGPVWRDGRLLFSDPNANRIYSWSAQDGLGVFREHSGYAGIDVAQYTQPGSNGLAVDAQGRLTINEHGNRRVTRLEADGSLTVLASHYDGKRLNSPNDLVYRSDGALYFTDPPFGLPKFADDPRRELPVSGVYRVKDGQVELLSDALQGPNGIAFSPDERWLYVGNWDPRRKVVMRFAVQNDGRLAPGEVLADLTDAPGVDAIDGIKVDVGGHLFVSGPGGIWVLSADGRRLGRLRAPRQVHNMAWGDADRRSLYLTAHDRLYRLPLRVQGAPVAQVAK